jgi:hypothetical protein
LKSRKICSRNLKEVFLGKSLNQIFESIKTRICVQDSINMYIHYTTYWLSVGFLSLGLVACDLQTFKQATSADSKLLQSPSVSEPSAPARSDSPSTGPQPTALSSMPPKPNISANTISNALQPFIRDVVQLEVLGDEVVSNEPVTRSLFVRWLVEANNRFYRDRPVRQIRVPSTASAIFQDVAPTDPHAVYIQGLAESGYLPSPLSGDSTQTKFQPQAPLTRETLLLWKVPVDRQQILPTVSAERVKQLWGFKDAQRITPMALGAVAADRQNGDLSNIRRMFGSTLLFQPQKPVTRAEAVAALWFIGVEGEALSAQDFLRAEQRAKSTAVEQAQERSAVMPSPSWGPPIPSQLPSQDGN